MTAVARAALIALLAIVMAGCASVPAWERGNLAKPQMAFDLEPSQTALREHVYSSREAAMQGAGRKVAPSEGTARDAAFRT